MNDTPAGDTIRMYLDDLKVFDGKGPARGELDLEARTYRVRSEYVHASEAPPLFRPNWQMPGAKGFGELQAGSYFLIKPLPFIQEVKGGPGDQFHLVAPQKIAAAAMPGGAKVGNDEFVMAADEPQSVTQPGLVFNGKVAYARPGELALFEGTNLEMNGLGLSRTEGDFGASVKQTSPKSLEGRVAGRAGGTLRVHLPPSFPADSLKVTCDGHEVPVNIQNGIMSIPVEIKQADGFKAFSIVGM